MMFSLAGGVVSMLVMCLLYKLKFGTTAVAIAGAVAHNVGQVGLAMMILETDRLVYYMAVLMLVGLVTGFVTGTLARILDRRLPDGLKP